MTWRVARCITVLLDEANAAWPERDKTSDGTIGDPAHFSRGDASDHNPWVIDAAGVGVVRAVDITNDPASGCDVARIAERIRILGAGGDPRLSNGGYVIFNRQKANARSAWQWRAYLGVNPHVKHAHISVSRDPAGYDSTAPWGIAPPVKPPALPPLEELLQMELTDTITIPATGYASNNTGKPLVVTLAEAIRRTYEWSYRAAHTTPQG